MTQETIPAARYRELPAKRHKYGVSAREDRTLDGIVFSSKGEMNRYQELRLLQKAGHISGLRRQIQFRLTVQGEHVCNYVADFVYVEHEGGKSTKVVEDFKGVRTETYRLKARLMKAVYGIDIRETGAKR